MVASAPIINPDEINFHGGFWPKPMNHREYPDPTKTQENLRYSKSTLLVKRTSQI
jgi:hypothetical protein